MVTAQQFSPVATMQGGPVAGAQLPAPYTPYVAPAQVDITSIINMIMPIMMLMMVFGMMMPMMKSMTGAFE